MHATKYSLSGVPGVAAVLVLTSDKARGMGKDLPGQAKGNAGKWGDMLKTTGSTAGKRLSELKDLPGCEMDG